MASSDGEPDNEQLKSAIEEILESEDLASLSSKKVRLALQEKFDSDMSLRKQQVDDILMKLINERQSAPAHQTETEKQKESESDSDADDDKPDTSKSNGFPTPAKREAHSDDARKSKPDVKKPRLAAARPSTSKAKSAAVVEDDSDSSNGEVDDAAMARKLQAQELGMRIRPRNRRTAQTSEKKSKDKEPGKKRGGNSIYSQECVLSEELAAVMKTDRMARKDVVSKLWQIFKERNLQDPKNKQYVICDEELLKVFKTKRFKAFGMMKILKNHIKDARLITT